MQKKKVVKMSTFWDDPPPVVKIHNFFFWSKYLPKGRVHSKKKVKKSGRLIMLDVLADQNAPFEVLTNQKPSLTSLAHP